MTDEPSSTPAPAGALRLTVFGANGGTGRAVVEQALDAGHVVTAVTRHPEQIALSHPALTVLRGDATISGDVRAAIDGSDAVLSALGVPYSRQPITLYSRSAVRIADEMQRVGIRRLVAVTSSAVDPDAHPEGGIVGKVLIGPLIHRLGHTMYEDMSRMEEIVAGSDLDWTIFRPPALFDKAGPGPTNVSTEPDRARFAARQDLAAEMLREVVAPHHLRRIVYISSLEGHPSILRTIWRDGIRKKG